MRKRKIVEPRILKHEEKVLWNLVTRTVSPMKSRVIVAREQRVFDDHMDSLFPPTQKPKPIKHAGIRSAKAASSAAEFAARDVAQPKIASSPPPISAHIDKPVYRKIAKGRLPIDSTIDLHEMTQDQAVNRLQRFLNQARNNGYRHVLVITGKGGSPTSEGILRRMLPIWLNTPAFSSIVNGYQAASREHGGDGAFYVRLRKVR